MAIIPSVERVLEFRTDRGVEVRAGRAFFRIDLVAVDGTIFRRSAMIDPGAPWSVLPFTLWQGSNLSWQLLGSQLTRNQTTDAAALTWFGVPCQFAETQVWLVDELANVRSCQLRLQAKLPLSKIPSHPENDAVLGYNFLVDNGLTLAMRGGTGKLDAVLLAD